MDVVERIIQFAADTSYESIPSEVRSRSRWAMTDTLGVTIPGSREKSPHLSAELARSEKAEGAAWVLARNFKTSAINAALANGTASHVLDFDHSFVGMGQPMASVTPAIWSVGNAIGASGKALIEAHVIGFEVAAQLLFALRTPNERSWNSPGRLVGSYGTTVACGKLLGLNAQQLRSAVGITVLTANGIFHLGQMDKSLQVGLAAQQGVFAALMAKSGFYSDAAGIEISLGFPDGKLVDDEPIENLGRSYALETAGARIKPYPCGGIAHGVIDAVLDLRAEHGITPEMVEAIDAEVSRTTINLGAFPVPRSGIEGKFSLGYILARGLMHGKIPVDAFTDAGVKDPTALALASKLNMTLDTSLRTTPGGSHPCHVRIRLRDGRTVERRIEHMRGTRDRPVTEPELRAKFSDCTVSILGEDVSRRSLELLENLEDVDDVSLICYLLSGTSANAK